MTLWTGHVEENYHLKQKNCHLWPRHLPELVLQKETATQLLFHCWLQRPFLNTVVNTGLRPSEPVVQIQSWAAVCVLDLTVMIAFLLRLLHPLHLSISHNPNPPPYNIHPDLPCSAACCRSKSLPGRKKTSGNIPFRMTTYSTIGLPHLMCVVIQPDLPYSLPIPS